MKRLTTLKINIITLGCSKNLVDSEHLAGVLKANGHEVLFDSTKKKFDVAIINTCGFIGDAKEESIDVILEYIEEKKKGNIKNILVFGCLVERYKETLEEEFVEIDAFFGVNNYLDIATYLNAQIEKDFFLQRQPSTPKHFAYLKISEGCDRFCSFCAIPYIRGRHISISIEELVEEAKCLAKRGVKEIIIIAQDTCNYGKDLYGKVRLVDLLKEIAKIEQIEWIRLQYSYPNDFNDELIEFLATEPKMCKYIDMPLQHINNRLLSSMNRKITGEEIRNLINKIREKIPQVCLRTTLIVGYPSESKEEFEELREFVEQTKFDRMGAFTYSAEENTAAFKLEDNISQEEKDERLDALTFLQEGVSLNLNQKKISKTFKVLIDRKEGEYYVGRTEFDSPEVDNEVLISIEEKIKIGNFYQVKITDAVEFDLYG
ncbi:MAG: 30S ribosomal protein S12 methylthiotransferase RimO, partial [Bacteroidales bacterium]|nr:30S ribosomal protein S12 methylthiotransferase RimO [Bacteroidales bacterium]